MVLFPTALGIAEANTIQAKHYTDSNYSTWTDYAISIVSVQGTIPPLSGRVSYHQMLPYKQFVITSYHFIELLSCFELTKLTFLTRAEFRRT